MAKNPLRNTDRAAQIKYQNGDVAPNIQLYHIDYAIMTYLQDVVLPPLDEDGKYVKMPVIYGNSERWNSARLEGIYRDQKGRIQLPLMMLRRSAVAKNENIPMLNRHVTYQAVTKYSKDNRYDRFGLLTGMQPKLEIYNITMPDYVEITYECMGWTNYSEHLNEVIESLNWASEEYWGDKDKFKFITFVSEYTVNNEITENNERINRVEFSLNVKAYLLPAKFDGEKTTKKGFSSRVVVVTSETDLTANGRMETLLSNPSVYNSNKDIVDYLSINNSETQTVAAGTIVLTGIKLIKPALGLSSVITGGITINSTDYDIKVYQNNTTQLTQNTNFSATYSESTNTLTINNFSPVLTDGVDTITIFGKFINV
jgi:hypothetical protein